MCYLWHEQLAGVQLLLVGLHPAHVLRQVDLQLFAAIHQRLDFRLHLTDVDASCGELLLHHSTRLRHLKTDTEDVSAWGPPVCLWRSFCSDRGTSVKLDGDPQLMSFKTADEISQMWRVELLKKFDLTALRSVVPRKLPISLRSLSSRLRISADLFLWWELISCRVENSLWTASRLTWKQRTRRRRRADLC